MKRKMFIVLAVLVSSLGITKGTHESSCVRFASPSNTLSSVGADVYFQKDDYLPDDSSRKIVKLTDAEEKGFTWQLFVLDVNGIDDNDWIDGWLFIKIYTGPVIPVKTVTVVAEDSYGRPIGEFVPFKEVPFHTNCNNAPFESVDLPGQYLPCRGIGAYDPIQPMIFHYSVEMNEKSEKGPPTFPWIHNLDHTKDRFEMYWKYSQNYCNMLSRFRFKAIIVSKEIVNGAHKHVVRETYSLWVYIENLLGSDPLHYYDQYRNCRPTLVNDSLIVITPYEWIVHYGNEDNPKFPPVSPIRCGRDVSNVHGSYTGRCSYKDDERNRKTDRKTEVFLEASYKNPPGCKPKDPNFKLTHEKFTDYMEYIIQFHYKPIPIGSGATFSESGCCYIIPDIPLKTTTATTKKSTTTTTTKKSTTTTTTKKSTTTTKKYATTTKEPVSTTKKSTTTTKKSATPTKESTENLAKSRGVTGVVNKIGTCYIQFLALFLVHSIRMGLVMPLLLKITDWIDIRNELTVMSVLKLDRILAKLNVPKHRPELPGGFTYEIWPFFYGSLINDSNNKVKFQLLELIVGRCPANCQYRTIIDKENLPDKIYESAYYLDLGNIENEESVNNAILNFFKTEHIEKDERKDYECPICKQNATNNGKKFLSGKPQFLAVKMRSSSIQPLELTPTLTLTADYTSGNEEIIFDLIVATESLPEHYKNYVFWQKSFHVVDNEKVENLNAADKVEVMNLDMVLYERRVEKTSKELKSN